MIYYIKEDNGCFVITLYSENIPINDIIDAEIEIEYGLHSHQKSNILENLLIKEIQLYEHREKTNDYIYHIDYRKILIFENCYFIGNKQ